MLKFPHKLFNKRYQRSWYFFFSMLISAYFFADIADDVFSDPKEGDFEAKHFDSAISSFAIGLKSPALTQIMTDLTAFGSISVVTVFVVILISILYSYRDLRGLSYVALVSVGAGVWPTVLKLIFARERPELENHLVTVTDFSFPSGHAFGATSIYIGLAFYAAKYAHTLRHEFFFYSLAIFLVVLVGVSRIYLGVHYPTDVLAGISGGVFWASLVSCLYSLPRSAKEKRLETGSHLS